MKLITLSQASAMSGYHQDYLSALIRKQEIYGEKVGRNWLTTEEAVRDYVFKQKIKNRNIVIQGILVFLRKNLNFIYGGIAVSLLVTGVVLYNQVYEFENQAKSQMGDKENPISTQEKINQTLQF